VKWTGKFPFLSKAPAKAAAPLPAPEAGLSEGLARILRPQAAYRWILPQLAAITPQYIESTLRGALAGSHVQAWELFDLMQDSWPRLAKSTQQVTDAVVQMNWQLSPFQEDDEEVSESAQERKKVVAAAFRNMRPKAAADENGFDDTIRDLCDGWFKGTVVLEMDWHAADAGKLGMTVGPRATFWVHPVCYAWGQDGTLGLRMGASNHGSNQSGKAANLWNSMAWNPMPREVQEFPPDKFLIGIHKAKSGTALAGALLRPLAWWWCAANFSADWLLNLAQVFGLPFRWAHYVQGTPQATIDSICQMLQSMGSAGWAAFPEGVQLDFKEATKDAGNSPQGDLLDRADRYCDLMILRQTLTTDVAESGSRALGEVHQGVERGVSMAMARYVAGVLNQQAIPSILRLNYGDETDAPCFVPTPDPVDGKFLREVWLGFQRDGTASDLLANATSLRELTKQVGLPVNAEYDEPYLPIRDDNGNLVTGGVRKDYEGDVVGGEAEEREESQKARKPESEEKQAKAAIRTEGELNEALAKEFRAAVVPEIAALKQQIGDELAAIALLKDSDAALMEARLRALKKRIERWRVSYELAPPGVEELHAMLGTAWANGVAEGNER
jgi:phage gp29-like protein